MSKKRHSGPRLATRRSSRSSKRSVPEAAPRDAALDVTGNSIDGVDLPSDENFAILVKAEDGLEVGSDAEWAACMARANGVVFAESAIADPGGSAGVAVATVDNPPVTNWSIAAISESADAGKKAIAA